MGTLQHEIAQFPGIILLALLAHPALPIRRANLLHDIRIGLELHRVVRRQNARRERGLLG